MMIYLLTAIITFVSTTGGLFLGIFIINYRNRKKQASQADEKKEKEGLNRGQAFINVFFEYKENLALLMNIKELIDEDEIDKTDYYIKKIAIPKVYELSRVKGLNKQDLELIENLHSVIIIKRKIEFYKKLHSSNKISLLELRANVKGLIEEASGTEEHIAIAQQRLFS